MRISSDAQITGHVADLVPAFVNGTLARSDRGQVRSHLQGCAACAADLAAWQAIRVATRASVVPPAAAPGAVLVKVWDQLDRQDALPREHRHGGRNRRTGFSPEAPDDVEHRHWEMTTMHEAMPWPPVVHPGSLRPTWPGRPRRSLQAQRAVATLLTVAALLALVMTGSLVHRPTEFAAFRGLLPFHQPMPPDVALYRGNPQRTGVMPGPGPLGKPDVLWRANTGGPMATSPVLAGGVVYTPSLDGSVYAFDAATGEERWHTEIGSSPQANLTVAEGVVLAGDNNPYQGDGTLFALDAADGHERWHLANAQTNSPLVTDGIAYVGTSDGHLLALNPRDGSERWRAAAAPMSRSPALADGLLYYGGRDGTVYALDATNGHERWRYQTAGGQLGTVAVDGGLVYQATIDGPDDQLYALDAATGAERWRFAIGTRLQGPTLSDGVVYIAGGDGSIYALDAAKGTVHWRFAVNDPNVFSPVIVGDTLYVTGGSSTVYAVDVASGKERWHVDVDSAIGTSPVVSGGVIYVVTDAGDLYALGQRTDEAPAVLPAPSDAATIAGPVEVLWQAANGSEPIHAPGGIAIAPDGAIWVVEGDKSRILIFSPDGAFREAWGSPGPSEGEFNFVLPAAGGAYGGLGFDPDGNLYVLDSGNYRVQKFDRNRNFVTAWGSQGRGNGQFEAPVTLAIDAQGIVYVGDDGRGDIQTFASDGTYLAAMASRGTGPGETECVADFDVDASGRLYLPDCKRHQIQVFTPDGTYLTTWGSEGTDDAQFRFPASLAVDAEGRIFVADAGNNRVQVLDAQGNFLAAWGQFGSEAGAFNGTGAIVLDGLGNIYVGDGNGRIQKFQLRSPLVPDVVATPS